MLSSRLDLVEQLDARGRELRACLDDVVDEQPDDRSGRVELGTIGSFGAEHLDEVPIGDREARTSRSRLLVSAAIPEHVAEERGRLVEPLGSSAEPREAPHLHRGPYSGVT